MKIIILENREAEKIINHFISYGFSELILFESSNKKINKEYYRLNDINITALNGFPYETTLDKLLKIKGSLNESFFVVYSKSIADFDIEKIIIRHKSSQKIATLVEYNKALCAALLESEALDYSQGAKSLEKEVILRMGEDQEIVVYK